MKESDFLLNELAVLGQPVLAGKLNAAQWCVDLFLTRCIPMIDSFCFLKNAEIEVEPTEIQQLTEGDGGLMIITAESKEWTWMWSQLKSADINRSDIEPVNCEHPVSGDVWEYQFSDPHECVHVFRHKNHPATQQNEWLRIAFSSNFQTSNSEDECDDE